MVVWISGASSGIGAPLAASVPYDAAVFLHMSGVATPTGPVVDADVDGYTQAVLLNAASSQVLGKAFLDAVDTPMVRTTIAQPPGATRVAERLRAAAERGDLATPEATAGQIWDLVLGDTTHGSAVAVGAVPAELRS